MPMPSMYVELSCCHVWWISQRGPKAGGCLYAWRAPGVVTLQSHIRLPESHLTLPHHFQDAEKGPAVQGCLPSACSVQSWKPRKHWSPPAG